MMTSGSSVMIASPIASALSAMPGPDEEVTPREPAKLAPIALPMAAISSSAWKVVTPYSLRRERWWRIALAGVIG
jgi:hypothetical protein